jgi:hypothetical protein
LKLWKVATLFDAVSTTSLAGDNQIGLVGKLSLWVEEAFEAAMFGEMAANVLDAKFEAMMAAVAFAVVPYGIFSPLEVANLTGFVLALEVPDPDELGHAQAQSFGDCRRRGPCQMN